MGDILGATQGDWQRLKGSVYNPNTGSYVNTADPGALSSLSNISGQQAALGNAGYGNTGIAAQQGALGDITQMAHGGGPSLAAANMNAGLNTTFQNLSNQAMSNQGNVGAGNSQRNLLNAQANAANNVTQQAGVASVAEQMGALQQESGAAQGLTQAQLQQGNFQRGLLTDQAGNAVNQASIGQQDTSNSMALDAANAAAQDKKNAYQAQANGATASRFSSGLGYIGQALSDASTIAGAVATGGGSLAVQGALKGVMPGSSGNVYGATGQAGGYAIPPSRYGS